MSSAPQHVERRPLDSYHTPPELARELVSLLPIRPGDDALEPHAGGGAFVDALLGRGARVCAIDIDPAAEGRSDLRLFAGVTADFLRCDPVAIGMPAPTWIVGNPPFAGFERHIDHALAVAPHVAFLLRLAAMESTKRAALWRRWPLRHVWVLAERPSFTGGGTDSAAYGFFYLERGYRGAARVTPGWSWRGGPNG